ncbi:phosphotransferase family protein [Fulvivirga lutea]|uniref:Phosphotransferase family protein n=1 Tax=Fulvivirga lutea TaxID=2810512 RepID=A0A974WG15_9BACT|nr:phosphotransferase family protein [Fulvivirga lutea]QSE97591.1 phosphotransferase family protein [Fulvivirga lutea]
MSTSIKDLETDQRSGEELDLEKLLPWLKNHLPTINSTPHITQFSGGASNWTYRLKFENQDLILRRAPLGKKAAGAHNMPREYELQKKLKPHYPYVPEMIALCDDESVLGSTFYVMERLEGIIPRKNFPREVNWDEKTVSEICHSFWDKLIELHNVDYEKEGLDDLGKGEGYIERQIVGWNKRFSDAKTWNVPSGKKVMHWLEQNMPAEEKLCIVHNDFRLDNVVLDVNNPSKILGVLDWELAAIGDPLMDLGNSLAYWVEENDDFFIKSLRRQPSNAPGMMTRKEIINYYTKSTGREIEDFRFYRVYGIFRLAGIIQQIYYRYSKGFTTNKAFKNFWIASIYMIRTCENIIKQKR